MDRQRVDVFAIVALLFLAFMGARALGDRLGEGGLQWPQIGRRAESAVVVKDSFSTGGAGLSSFVGLGDPDEFAAPHEQYELTQGLHGFDYGHMAIDLSAGKGAEIHSPINGLVVASFIDDLGNTTLILENDYYRVTLLHGLYSVELGERVALGQVLGVESNQGNTFDALGRSCRGRDCGYHTHLNVFDKRQGVNVDPLSLIR